MRLNNFLTHSYSAYLQNIFIYKLIIKDKLKSTGCSKPLYTRT